MSTCHHGLTAQTCASCKYGPAPDDTYNGPPLDIDYAWQARNHAVTERRNAKGATVRKVTRYGLATVQGAMDVDVHGRPLLSATGPSEHEIHPSTAAAMALLRMANRGELQPRRHGLSGIDIGRIADAAFGPLLPRVLNATDVHQYEQVIHRDRSAQSSVTAHSVGLGGGFAFDTFAMVRTEHADGTYSVSAASDHLLDEIVQENGANGRQTESQLPWATRGTSGMTQTGRLPIPGKRRTGDPRPTREIVWTWEHSPAMPYGRAVWRHHLVNGAHPVRGARRAVATAPSPVPDRVEQVPKYHGYYVPGFGRWGGLKWHMGTVPRLQPGVSSVRHHNGQPVADTVVTLDTTGMTDAIWHGHQLVARPEPSTADRGTKRAARTTLTTAPAPNTSPGATAEPVPMPTNAEAWVNLLGRLQPGDRADLGAITITRTPRGDYYCATVRGDAPMRHRARTARGLALKLTA